MIKGFNPGQYLGLTSLLGRKKDNGNIEVLPAYLDAEGNYRLVEDFDLNNILIYHRIISTAYGVRKKGSYGDGYVQSSVSEMIMVVISNMEKTRLRAESLESMVIFGMPDSTSPQTTNDLQLNSLITPKASVMDKILVFKQEYPNTDFFLKPHHQMFLIRYSIDQSFDKRCIDACLCSDT
jgi:hypothetical protein